jgi:hypothetical protein
MFNLYNRNNDVQPGRTFGSSSFGKVSDMIGDANGSPGIGPGKPSNTQLCCQGAALAIRSLSVCGRRSPNA